MIDVALLSVIRRWHFREGIAVREIVRRTNLARNTVRKYLFGGQLEPVYPKRTSPSKLDPFADTLSSWLEREALGEVARRTQILSYTGSPSRVNFRYKTRVSFRQENNTKVVFLSQLGREDASPRTADGDGMCRDGSMVGHRTDNGEMSSSWSWRDIHDSRGDFAKMCCVSTCFVMKYLQRTSA